MPRSGRSASVAIKARCDSGPAEISSACGDAQRSMADVSQPVLVVGNTADDACTPSHTHRLYGAIPHDRKRLHEVQGATHYYTGQNGRRHLAEAIGVIGDFLDDMLPA